MKSYDKMSLGRSRRLKRFIDICGSLLGLVLLSPLFFLVGGAIHISVGWPIIFRQKRPGLKKKIFTLYKFRTMKAAYDEKLWFRSDHLRLTTVGRFVRKFSLDEIPSFWNVLSGDMSLVGPRPLLIEYVSKYTPTQMKRHDVLPGITGWAQVKGRQKLPFSKRLELDVSYVDQWTNWLDLKILGMTVMQMFKSGGVIPGQNVDDVDDLGLSPDIE